jgi:anti-sigma B factor antagonist
VTFQRHIAVSDESVTVTARQIDNIVVLKVVGELDLAAAPHLEAAVAYALDDPDAVAVVVDLTAVTFLSSSGITILITAHQDAVQRRRPLRVVIGRCRIVVRALQLSGVDWLLALYDTLEQALDAGHRGALGAVPRR